MSGVRLSGKRMNTHAAIATPSTAMKPKIARQLPTWRIASPMVGATAGTIRKITKMMLIMRAILSPPTRSRMIAGGRATIPAAKKPWAARTAISAS